MRPASLFLAILPLLLPAQQKETLAGGPFAVNVNGKAATIGWVLQSGEVSLDGGRKIPVLRSEHVSMTGLKPGERVRYTLPNGASGSFLVPPTGPAAFQGVVFGDTRTRHDLHQKIMAAIAPWKPDFLIHTGDLVTDGFDTEQWPRFFSIEGPVLRETAFYPALGNHERNDRRFYEFFNVSTPYYSFDWAGVHFSVLNTDVGNVALSQKAKDEFWAEQARWLEDDLAKAAKAEFRIVITHHPAFTAVKNRQAAASVTEKLLPLFAKGKVAAVFSGHDHNYQHHLVDGIHHVITGGGGAPLYAVDAPIPNVTIKVESTEHYVRLIGEPGKVKVQAIALDGRTLDTFELTAR